MTIETQAAGSPPNTELQAELTQALLSELRQAREANVAQSHAMARERVSERRWRLGMRALLLGLPILVGVAYAVFIAGLLGPRAGPRSEAVGVVRVDGEIGADHEASARRLVPLLRRAFESPKVKAVVLAIDSPGGAPVESERINDAVRELRKLHNKPLVAVIGNTGASAAYMIAMHADKVYAGRYSVVGSVGAVMSAWQLDKALDRLGVAQRTFASGSLKAMMNPFEPMTAQADAKAHALVDAVGQAFVAELRSRRGDRLKAGVDFSTGEVWTGEEARALGLVDEIGTLDQVVQANWGVPAHDFGPGRDDLGLLGHWVQGAVGSAVRGALAEGLPRLR